MGVIDFSFLTPDGSPKEEPLALTQANFKSRLAALVADPNIPDDAKAELERELRERAEFHGRKAAEANRVDRLLNQAAASQDAVQLRRAIDWVHNNLADIPES